MLIGNVWTIAKGGELVLDGIERVTDVPLGTGARAVASIAFDETKDLLLAGADVITLGSARDVISKLRHPMHLFSRSTPRVGADDSDKQSILAQLWADLEGLLGKAKKKHRPMVPLLPDPSQRSPQQKQIALQAQGSDGFSTLATRIADKSKEAASNDDMERAIQLAQQAVALATLAMQPPTDAKDVLRSDDADETKQLKTDVINAVYSDDVDLDELASRLAGEPYGAGIDPGFYDNTPPTIQGHDCGGSCSTKKGAHKCGACQHRDAQKKRGGKAVESSAMDWTVSPEPEIAGHEHKGTWGSSMTWEEPRRAREEVAGDFDMSAITSALRVPDCPTGSCSVRRR